ncbi:hypothetical protein PENANT_c015G04198 [Penicillium antarcticum]|uniref:Myb-like DNA-binding domain-containing protein n=1 Tax=Penicillium antarcticum TaxID=416450 RepID=A0A1V6Q537_9EURO|nr:uncharacterized protein N7508_004954 [Penicillium antarcticum]KAJ5305939.1 hypothetical protein N7508_004954 [Penicillium antarcticum]OQD83896.1 hypothetical protein PENANT_c015G04198 [Penicillium antarcticum]
MVQRHKVLETDNPTAKFLYTIIKQLDLKSINWNRVASELEISNGHAARMRYSRFRQQMDGTTGVARAKRKPKKVKTVDPPTDMQMRPGFPMDLSGMPKMEPIDTSLRSNPFFKGESRIQGYSGMQDYANYSQSMPDNSNNNIIQSYPYLPQDFASRGFQYAARMSSGLPLVSPGTSFMNPYQSPEIQNSYAYALTAGSTGFETQDFGMQSTMTNFGPTISWGQRPSSPHNPQAVKVEGRQQPEAGTLNFGEQLNSLPVQPETQSPMTRFGPIVNWEQRTSSHESPPNVKVKEEQRTEVEAMDLAEHFKKTPVQHVDHSMNDVVDGLAEQDVQYPIQGAVQNLASHYVESTAHNQVQNATDCQAQYPSQNSVRTPSSLHIDLSAQAQPQQIAEENLHHAQQKPQDIIAGHRVDSPASIQTQPTTPSPTKSPIRNSAGYLLEKEIGQLVQRPIQQPDPKSDQQTVETSAQVASQKAAQEPIQPVQPVQPIPLIQQPAQQLAQTPDRTPIQEPAQCILRPDQYYSEQPTQQPSQPPAQNPVPTIVDHQFDTSPR